MSLKLTIEKFLDRAKFVHGEEYDYTKVEIKRSDLKVKITHKKCGTLFMQTPNNHINGKQGCPNCFGKFKKDLLQFIYEARIIHGEEFNYNEAIYKNIDIPISISHLKCGKTFLKSPYDHLKGAGCPHCRFNCSKGNENFIKQSKQKFQDEYDYSFVNYKNNFTKITLLHKECKTYFEILPFNHLKNKSKGGCPKCFKLKMETLTTEEFIKRAKSLHGDIYDYSETSYKGSALPLKIIHPKCGREFYQVARVHLRGHGCKCLKCSKGEALISKLLKERDIEFERQVTFNELRNPKTKRPLFFDFLVRKNLVIEFDGAHHRQPVRFGGRSYEKALNSFGDIKFYDKLKDDFCNNNNLKIIRINSIKEIYIQLGELL